MEVAMSPLFFHNFRIISLLIDHVFSVLYGGLLFFGVHLSYTVEEQMHDFCSHPVGRKNNFLEFWHRKYIGA